MLKKNKGFTLAEVLITLAIIGVVAALTIPTLITNHQKQQYVTQLKKNYSVLTNGFKTATAKEGVAKVSDTTVWSKCLSSPNALDKENCKAELAKIFSAVSFSSNEIPYSYLNSEGSAGSISDGLVLSDGTIIIYGSIDSGFVYEESDYAKEHNMPKGVGMFYIDTNGEKKPNTFGRDFFYLLLFDDGSIHAPGDIFTAKYACGEDYASCGEYWRSVPAACSTDVESMGIGCAARIMEEGWKMDY